MNLRLFCILLCSLIVGSTYAKSLPNIVLVMADDQGWGDMAYNGHPLLKTPNFDKAAATGLRFDRFYAAAPVCSPTRGSVLTGRHPIRFKITNHGRYMRPQETTIAEALRDRYDVQSVAKLHGETPDSERQQIVESFQDRQSDLRFLVGHPKTGGFGLTLTAANTVIYYSNSYDLELRVQSEDRAHRIGQENKVTYVDLLSPGTIDEKIVGALRSKIRIADQILGETVRKWLD